MCQTTPLTCFCKYSRSRYFSVRLYSQCVYSLVHIYGAMLGVFTPSPHSNFSLFSNLRGSFHVMIIYRIFSNLIRTQFLAIS